MQAMHGAGGLYTVRARSAGLYTVQVAAMTRGAMTKGVRKEFFDTPTPSFYPTIVPMACTASPPMVL